jgi:hypothetical protein
MKSYYYFFQSTIEKIYYYFFQSTIEEICGLYSDVRSLERAKSDST